MPPADQITDEPRDAAQRARRAPAAPEPCGQAQKTMTPRGQTAQTARTTAQSRPEAQPTDTEPPARTTRTARAAAAETWRAEATRPPANPITEHTTHLPQREQRRARTPERAAKPTQQRGHPKQRTRDPARGPPGIPTPNVGQTAGRRTLELVIYADKTAAAVVRGKNSQHWPMHGPLCGETFAPFAPTRLGGGTCAHGGGGSLVIARAVLSPRQVPLAADKRLAAGRWFVEGIGARDAARAVPARPWETGRHAVERWRQDGGWR